MQFDVHCIECLVRRHYRLALEHGDGVQADAYLRDVLRIILDAPAGVSAPWLTGEFTKAFQKYWPHRDAYAELKQRSNDQILQLLPQIRPLVEQADDPLAMALKFARTGNFLDFGILTPEAAEQALRTAVAQTPEAVLEPAVYAALLADLRSARTLLILGDNAGEIVFDLLLAEQLRLRYPSLRIVYCVRGENTLNDATRADAAYVGMDRLAEIIDNGSAISGTEIAYAGDDLAAALREADVILSKGSGNMESLVGCGLNVYYVFMCKCARMSRMLGVENMSGQFLREKALPPLNPMVGPL